MAFVLVACIITVAIAVTYVQLSDNAEAIHDMPCADLNGDKNVTTSDFDILLSYLNLLVPPAPAAADLDQSGVIGFPDFLVFLQQGFGPTNCQDTPIHGLGPYLGVGDDTIPSMGKFRILVAPEFRSLMTGYPGWDGTSRLDSPTLIDPATVIGRSAPHVDGDATDTGGAVVGTAGTVISDGSFSLVPPGIEGPAGSREIHTEIVTLNLTGFGAAVRAGSAAPAQPISPGEVESLDPTGNPVNDFPSESFFNVFVEIDLPAAAGFPGGTLYNTSPLLVISNKVERLPPQVVYIHGNTSAVPILFRSTNAGFWLADDLFGHLVLAGHGSNFDSGDGTQTGLFDQIYAEIEQTQGELPLPEGIGGIAQLADFDQNVAKTDEASSSLAGRWMAIVVAGLLAVLGVLMLSGVGLYVRARRKIE
ncbi:MAG: hypothetical protein IH958_02510 [Chloroflexi bacterium]|nr:hypothetical protein [Chloroflexota bacterium]